MKKQLKVTLLILNFGILVLAVLWYLKESGYEPIIVFIGQLLSILVLTFEKKLSNVSIKDVSKSKVDIDTSVNDATNISIEDIKDKSKIKIKRK